MGLGGAGRGGAGAGWGGVGSGSNNALSLTSINAMLPTSPDNSNHVGEFYIAYVSKNFQLRQ